MDVASRDLQATAARARNCASVDGCSFGDCGTGAGRCIRHEASRQDCSSDFGARSRPGRRKGRDPRSESSGLSTAAPSHLRAVHGKWPVPRESSQELESVMPRAPCVVRPNTGHDVCVPPCNNMHTKEVSSVILQLFFSKLGFTGRFSIPSRFTSCSSGRNGSVR